MVPGTGIEPVRPLCRKAADFKSDVSTNSTTRARLPIVKQKGPSDQLAKLLQPEFSQKSLEARPRVELGYTDLQSVA